ncbi:MAG TPA: M56 family metallopeptidase [Rhizomicrobium sp.]|nr:M56 family metallopeptidase [Rhizomicrobium sp.]
MAALLDHLWQSSLVALLVGALTLLFRNNSAGVRHGLWFAASLKFLLPFSLLAALGRALFSHTVAGSSIQMLARIEPAAIPFAGAQPVLAPQHPSWTVILGMIWLLGFAAVTIFWLLRAARLSAIVRAAKPLPLIAPVPVKATPELLEPGLAGIFRPVILLPQTLTQSLSGMEIDTIIAHELCHLRRRDNLSALLHMLVEAVFWFHPLVWFIGTRLVEERERACDDSVLDTGKKPRDYAEIILKVCRLTFRSPLPCASGVSGSDLDRRITAIMARRDAEDVDPNKILLLAGLSLFAVMTPFVIGGLKPAPAVSLAQSLTQAFAPVQQASQPVPVTADLSRHKMRGTARANSASVRPRTVLAPKIGADLPIIIVPIPQLTADESATPASKTEAPVCRPPQYMPDSHLMGPRVCLSRQAWDQLKAEGLLLMPDGRTVTESYNKTSVSHPMTCAGGPMGASTATSWNTVCRQ